DGVSKQVRIRVGRVLARGVVMMRAIPHQVRALDVARLDPGHPRVIIMCFASRSRRDRGNGYVLRGPLPVVPLADESAPVLNVQLDSLSPHFERGSLIAIGGGRQHVNSVKAARRKINRLPFRYERVGCAGLRGSQLKLHAVKLNLRRQHLRGQCIAFAVKSNCRLRAAIRTMISSLCSSCVSPNTRMRGLLTFSSENSWPKAPACFEVSNAISGAFSRCPCQSLCPSRQPPACPDMP